PLTAVAVASVVVDGAVLVPPVAPDTCAPVMDSVVVSPVTALTQSLVRLTAIVLPVLVNVHTTGVVGIVKLWVVTTIGEPFVVQASDVVYEPLFRPFSSSETLTVEPDTAVAVALVVVEGATLLPPVAPETCAPEIVSDVESPMTALIQAFVSVTV